MGFLAEPGQIGNGVWKAVSSNLGNSTDLGPTGVPARNIGGFLFPAIPAGTPTTIIPIAFPVTTAGPSPQQEAVEELQILAIFALAGLIWMLPWACANGNFCCMCCKRFLSRRLQTYFCLGLVLNLVMISCVIAAVPDVSANDVFFKLVTILEILCDKLQELLTQLTVVVALVFAWSFRQKVVALLGFDSQLVRADLRDCLTCFSMSRFSTIEVSVLKATDLPAGFSSRSLFLRVLLGCNEPLHSRPRDGCTTSMAVKERMQLNYDPEDHTQKLSIVIKQQEVVGQAVRQLAPAVGALAGGAAGLVTPLGPQGGAMAGAVAGIGTANSLGPEIARLDLNYTMVNHIRDVCKQKTPPSRVMSTGPSVPWHEEYFERRDLVPQGTIWLRIVDREKV